MRILLTNDDGIMAEGIYALAKELEKEHEVIIIAPEFQSSAQSHAVTLLHPLTVKEVKLDGLKSKAYSISGTPADCVRAGLEVLIKEPVDYVFSGINMGLNSGMDILYSGTVSAAIEASMYGIPSLAVSSELLNGSVNLDVATQYAKEIFDKVKVKLRNTKIVLNINVPHRKKEEIKGIKVCKVGGVVYDYYIVEEGENKEKVIKLNGRKNAEPDDDTDRYYLKEGYVTVTPLHYDLTDFKLMEEVKGWIKWGGGTMFRIRSKEEVLGEYKKRYPELDKFALEELSKEYDRYLNLIKNLETKEEVMEVFQREIEKNERRYRDDNDHMTLLEGSPHEQFMEILANYGLIVFFRDNMIE